MKTPDKIYMPNELLTEDWQRHIEGKDTAYIRKDLILETLRAEDERTGNDARSHKESFRSGYQTALRNISNWIKTI